MEFITFFTERISNPILLGGKGSNIIKLIEIGVNVPPGFIVNTNSFNSFIKNSNLGDRFKEILSKNLHSKEIMKYSAKIKNLILESRIPREILNEIRIAINKLQKKNGNKVSFSIRSSATIEDSKNFSFAGQANTYLYYKTFNEIINSIKNCWASLFSPQSLLYLLHMINKGITFSLFDVQMAVIIQEMVNSYISGVLFTVNVVNNKKDQMLINSAWGLGDAIANNSIIPDTFIINKEKFEIIKRNIGKKEKKSLPNPKSSGTIMVDSDPQSRMIFSLNEKQMRQLCKLGIRVESAFQCPQDIEWAIESDIIYILQTRPITTLK